MKYCMREYMRYKVEDEVSERRGDVRDEVLETRGRRAVRGGMREDG